MERLPIEGIMVWECKRKSIKTSCYHNVVPPTIVNPTVNPNDASSKSSKSFKKSEWPFSFETYDSVRVQIDTQVDGIPPIFTA